MTGHERVCGSNSMSQCWAVCMGVLPLHARVYLCADLLLLNKCPSLQPAYVIDLYYLTDSFTTYTNAVATALFLSGAVSIVSIACSCTGTVRAFKNLLRS